MTSSFDLSASLRRLKPQSAKGAAIRRNDQALPFVSGPTAAGLPILLDTTVYIDALQDRLPDEVLDLMSVRQAHHSAIAVGELAHNFGRLDPNHSGTAGVLRILKKAIDRIPRHRLSAPSPRVLVEAAILSGMVARARGLKASHRLLYNDAILFLQALEQGCALLSRNIVDFDLLQQALPSGRILLYRQAP